MKRRGRVARNRPAQRPRQVWWTARWLAALLALLILLTGALIWAVSQGSGGGAEAFPPTSTALVMRAALNTPAPGAATVGALLPSPTPIPAETPIPLAAAEALALPSTSGRTLTLRSFSGKKLVLFFFLDTT